MHEILATTDNPSKTTNPETTNVSTTDEKKIRAQAREDGNSSTLKPVIVWVSVPERRGNLDRDRGKFAIKNTFTRHVDDNINLQDIGPPKIDYVKNIHKGNIHKDFKWNLIFFTKLVDATRHSVWEHIE